MNIAGGKTISKIRLCMCVCVKKEWIILCDEKERACNVYREVIPSAASNLTVLQMQELSTKE